MKIHYKHHKLRYHACGVGNPPSDRVTENLSNVTCQKCLRSVTASKRSFGGRPVTGQAKSSLTIRLPKKMIAWIDNQGCDRTAVIQSIIEEKMREASNGG